MTDIKHSSFHLILTDTEYINSVILEDTYALISHFRWNTHRAFKIYFAESNDRK